MEKKKHYVSPDAYVVEMETVEIMVGSDVKTLTGQFDDGDEEDGLEYGGTAGGSGYSPD